VRKVSLKDSDKLKVMVRKKSMDEDSDDFSKGYDSTSSEEAETLMYQLEHMELGRHMPGSKVAYKAQMIYENQKRKAMEDQYQITDDEQLLL
jgi:predicted DNA-binding antitoxin AbrB/MazE fold protein